MYKLNITWEDVLNGVNDAVVYKHLKKCDPVMQKIIVMLKNKYCVREIAEDLHMTTNAVIKESKNSQKKCKKERLIIDDFKDYLVKGDIYLPSSSLKTA